VSVGWVGMMFISIVCVVVVVFVCDEECLLVGCFDFVVWVVVYVWVFVVVVVVFDCCCDVMVDVVVVWLEVVVV